MEERYPDLVQPFTATFNWARLSRKISKSLVASIKRFLERLAKNTAVELADREVITAFGNRVLSADRLSLLLKGGSAVALAAVLAALWRYKHGSWFGNAVDSTGVTSITGSNSENCREVGTIGEGTKPLVYGDLVAPAVDHAIAKAFDSIIQRTGFGRYVRFEYQDESGHYIDAIKPFVEKSFPDGLDDSARLFLFRSSGTEQYFALENRGKLYVLGADGVLLNKTRQEELLTDKSVKPYARLCNTQGGPQDLTDRLNGKWKQRPDPVVPIVPAAVLTNPVETPRAPVPPVRALLLEADGGVVQGALLDDLRAMFPDRVLVHPDDPRFIRVSCTDVWPVLREINGRLCTLSVPRPVDLAVPFTVSSPNLSYIAELVSNGSDLGQQLLNLTPDGEAVELTKFSVNAKCYYCLGTRAEQHLFDPKGAQLDFAETKPKLSEGRAILMSGIHGRREIVDLVALVAKPENTAFLLQE
ncbi:MAG: hypothetical protein QG604_227 [Candidatus Dependentiae bacterium]|nr:hypothetical protein [Candidatus Dependentiae bacterium]